MDFLSLLMCHLLSGLTRPFFPTHGVVPSRSCPPSMARGGIDLRSARKSSNTPPPLKDYCHGSRIGLGMTGTSHSLIPHSFNLSSEDFVNMRANNLRSIPFTITSNQDPDRSILVPQLTQKPEGLKMDSISSRIEPLFQAGSVSTVEEGLPEGALVSGCGIAEMGPEGWQLLLPPSSGASNRPWWCRWIPSSSSSFSSITPPLLLMRGGWEEAVDLVEHEFQRSIRWSWCIGLGLGTVLLFFLLSPRHTTHPGDDILGA